MTHPTEKKMEILVSIAKTNNGGKESVGSARHAVLTTTDISPITSVAAERGRKCCWECVPHTWHRARDKNAETRNETDEK